MRRNGSIFYSIYGLVGLICVFAWGFAQATFNALAAQDITGVLMGLARCVFVVVLWLLMLIFHFGVPF